LLPSCNGEQILRITVRFLGKNRHSSVPRIPARARLSSVVCERRPISSARTPFSWVTLTFSPQDAFDIGRALCQVHEWLPCRAATVPMGTATAYQLRRSKFKSLV